MKKLSLLENIVNIFGFVAIWCCQSNVYAQVIDMPTVSDADKSNQTINADQPPSASLPSVATPQTTVNGQNDPGNQAPVNTPPKASEAAPVAEKARDPFKPFEEHTRGVELGPLQKYEIIDLKVVGILWDVSNPKAMIVDPAGVTHIAKKKTKIGRNDGFIALIRQGEVIVVEPYEERSQIFYNTRVLPVMR